MVDLFNMLSAYGLMILDADDIIYLDISKVYLFKKGLAYLWEIKVDGSEVLLDILSKDSVVELATNQNSYYEFRIKETSELYILNWKQIHSNQLTLEVLKKLRDFYIRSQKLGSIIRMKYVEDRLINLLAFLAKEFGRECKETNELTITLPFTHEQIASVILSTRATVTKIINDLKRNNILRYQHINGKRYIQLTNRFWENYLNNELRSMKLVLV